MPQYAYTIGGQRHLFEGPDPQTTARFAQRWAAQEAGRVPVTREDIQRRLGTGMSQFALDLDSRTRDLVGGLEDTIADIKAHPKSLLTAPKLLAAVARYGNNALGLAPASGVDQVTGPVIRGYNARFGTDFDPHYTTDQLLNGAGLLAAAPEAFGLDTLLAKAGETADATRGLAAEVGKPSVAASSKPQLAVAYRAPEIQRKILGQLAPRDTFVPLSDGFVYNHQQRMKELEDLPDDVQDAYHSAIEDHIIGPIMDDPDYRGHDAAAVQNIIRELQTMADGQRASGGVPRLADALDAANDDFRAMVNQQQPKMARELGLAATGGSSDAEAGAEDIGRPGELVNFEQHIPPPPDQRAPVSDVDLDVYGEDIGKYLRQVGKLQGAQRVKSMLEAWKDMDLTANDNAPAANWAGRAPPKQSIDYPLAEDFAPPKPLGGGMTFPDTLDWMKTAANDNGPVTSDEYLQNYLTGLWGPPQRDVGMGGRAPGTQLRTVWSAPQASPTNAFSGAPSRPQALNLTPPFSTPRQASGLDFNALRPPRWVGPVMVGAANLPQDPAPQN